MTGTVTTWRRDKGFGFITPSDLTQPDHFALYSWIVGRKFLVPGETVEFDSVTDEQGRQQAHNVRVIAPAGKAAQG